MLDKLLKNKAMDYPCDSGVRQSYCTGNICDPAYNDRVREVHYYDSVTGQECKVTYECNC